MYLNGNLDVFGIIVLITLFIVMALIIVIEKHKYKKTEEKYKIVKQLIVDKCHCILSNTNYAVFIATIDYLNKNEIYINHSEYEKILDDLFEKQSNSLDLIN